jgi:transposase
MLIIGCDFHPSFQQVAIDNQRGEIEQRRLKHREEAEQFYRALTGEALVGMEAWGHYRWFERLLAECGHQLWLGDAAQIRASVARKQKTDRRDAEQLLDLLLEGRFPRIWVPSGMRQLLMHRAQASAGTDASKESAAGDSAEPGRAEEAQAVVGGRT